MKLQIRYEPGDDGRYYTIYRKVFFMRFRVGRFRSSDAALTRAMELLYRHKYT